MTRQQQSTGRVALTAVATALAAALSAILAFGYGSPNYNDMNTGEISFHLEYPNKIHTWATVKAIQLLRDDGYPKMADFAHAYLLPMMLGNAWNDHWGDRVVMTEGVLLDYFHPDPSEHNNGYGDPDADIFTGIDHSTDEFAACPFWGVENAGQHAEHRLQAGRRACWGRWGDDPRDSRAGYVQAIRDTVYGFDLIKDPIHGAWTDDVNALPWHDAGKAPAMISELLANRCNTHALFPEQSNPWLSTIHVPRPEEQHDRDDWFADGDWKLRGFMGPDGAGKQAYVCFAGSNGLAFVLWVAPDSLEHAFFNLGWAMHLVQDSSLPMHATDDEWDTFNGFRHNDYEDRWGSMLSDDWNTHIGGPLLEDALPVSDLDDFRGLYVFPPQRTNSFAESLAVDPSGHFRPRWYRDDLMPLLRPGEGVAHGYVRLSAEMAQAHLPYLSWADDEPDPEDAPFSLGFLLVWSTDLAIKTSAGLLHHFLTDVVQLREGEDSDSRNGALLNTQHPYRVVGDVTVPAGETLTIGPGVTVQLDPGTRLRVQGTLRIEGAGAPVTLRSTTAPSRGMRISNELVLRNGAVLAVYGPPGTVP
jgi:hypothetical protein